jgi:hypothetical protein
VIPLIRVRWKELGVGPGAVSRRRGEQRGGAGGGVGVEVGEQAAAGAAVAEVVGGARLREVAGGGVVLVGGDGAGEVADLRGPGASSYQ